MTDAEADNTGLAIPKSQEGVEFDSTGWRKIRADQRGLRGALVRGCSQNGRQSSGSPHNWTSGTSCAVVLDQSPAMSLAIRAWVGETRRTWVLLAAA